MPGQAPDTLFAARLHDSVIGFLERTLREPSSGLDHARYLEQFLCRFTEAVRRFLVRVPIKVVWQDEHVCTAASCTHMLDPAKTSEDGAEELQLIHDEPRRSQDYPPISISWFAMRNSPTDALRLSTHTESPVNNGCLWLIVPGDDADTKWKELCSCIPALKLLFLTLAMPLSVFRTGRRLHDLETENAIVVGLRARARYLSSARFASLPDRLERTVKWIEDLAASAPKGTPPSATLLLAENLDVLVSLLQQLLATGWTDRFHDSHGPRDPASLLNRILRATQRSVDGGAQDSLSYLPQTEVTFDKQRFELERVADALSAVLTRRPVTLTPGHSTDTRRELLRVLPFWVGIQEPFRDACSDDKKGLAARSRLASRDNEELASLIRCVLAIPDISAPAGSSKGHDVPDARSVSDALQATKVAVANHLARGWSDASTPEEAPHTSSFGEWLHLWLSLEVLKLVGVPDGFSGLLDGERLAVGADLGYVIREGIRKALYRDRQDYSYQPETFLAALRTLVDYHARKVGNIQHEYDLPALLDDIGQSCGPDQSCSPTDHLQHVLDVYLTGHYLLSLNLKETEEHNGTTLHRSVTMADRLASQFGTEAAGYDLLKLRRAFSIAALAHDYGYLLYPSIPWSHNTLQHANRRLPSQLVTAPSSNQGTGQGLIERCVNALVQKKIVDPEKEPLLSAWIGFQSTHGQPDHGLLAACYVEHLASSVPGEERDVISAATRAVLLHNATVKVDVENDPVAALLVLCNELCEWDQLRHVDNPPSSIRRSLRSATAPSLSREPRFARLGFTGLCLEAQEPDVLVSWLPVDQPWPQIEAVLQPSPRLDIPSFLLWLQKAQSIGRLKHSDRCHWEPCMTVSGEVTPVLRDRGLTGRLVLEWLAQHSKTLLRPGLARWITDVRPFRENDPGYETVLLSELGFAICSDDVRRHCTELEKEAEEYVFSSGSTI